VVFCNLLKVLPESVGVVPTRAVGSQFLEGPGIHLLITHRFTYDLTNLSGNFREGVLFPSVERVYLSFVLVRREKNFRDHAGLIFRGDRCMPSSPKGQPQSACLDQIGPIESPLSEKCGAQMRGGNA